MRGAQADLFDQRKPAAVFYRVGDRNPHRIFHEGYAERWPAVQESIAALVGCAPGDVVLKETFWGEDNSAELAMVGDEIVGSFNHPLSKRAVAAIRRALAGKPRMMKRAGAKALKPRRTEQREMLLPIPGKKAEAKS